MIEAIQRDELDQKQADDEPARSGARSVFAVLRGHEVSMIVVNGNPVNLVNKIYHTLGRKNSRRQDTQTGFRFEVRLKINIIKRKS